MIGFIESSPQTPRDSLYHRSANAGDWPTTQPRLRDVSREINSVS